MKAIIDILYLEEYKLLLLLNNGQEQIVNLEKTIATPEFEPLKEIESFSKFSMINGTVSWSIGLGLAQDEILHLIEEELEAAA